MIYLTLIYVLETKALFNTAGIFDYNILNISFSSKIEKNPSITSALDTSQCYKPFNEIFMNVFDQLCADFNIKLIKESGISYNDYLHILKTYKEHTASSKIIKKKRNKNIKENYDILNDELIKNKIYNILKTFAEHFFGFFTCCVFNYQKEEKILICYKKLFAKYSDDKNFIFLTRKTEAKLFDLAKLNCFTVCNDFFTIFEFVLYNEAEFLNYLKEYLLDLLIELIKLGNETIYVIFTCCNDDIAENKLLLIKKIIEKSENLRISIKEEKIPCNVRNTDFEFLFKNLFDFTFIKYFTEFLRDAINLNLSTIVNIDLNYYEIVANYIFDIYEKSNSLESDYYKEYAKKEFFSFFDDFDKIREKKDKIIIILQKAYENILKNIYDNHPTAYQTNLVTYKIVMRIFYFPVDKLPKKRIKTVKSKFKGKENDWPFLLDIINCVYKEVNKHCLELLNFKDIDFFWKTEIYSVGTKSKNDYLTDAKVFKYLTENTNDSLHNSEKNLNNVIENDELSKKVSKSFLLNLIKNKFDKKIFNLNKNEIKKYKTKI